MTLQIAPNPGECPERTHGEHYWVDARCSCGVMRHEHEGSYWYSYNPSDAELGAQKIGDYLARRILGR